MYPNRRRSLFRTSPLQVCSTVVESVADPAVSCREREQCGFRGAGDCGGDADSVGSGRSCSTGGRGLGSYIYQVIVVWVRNEVIRDWDGV